MTPEQWAGSAVLGIVSTAIALACDTRPQPWHPFVKTERVVAWLSRLMLVGILVAAIWEVVT
jgi:hypothetical protein